MNLLEAILSGYLVGLGHGWVFNEIYKLIKNKKK